MDIDAYFRRIGYAGPRAPTRETLWSIARRHALAIPFENLSVLVAGPPDLGVEALEDKLVRRGRGGYCYEQNGLLLAALTALGYRVKGLSARVRYGLPAEVLTPRSHMILLVETADGPALVDVGFGGLTLTAPILMREEEQATPHEVVRLVSHDDGRLLQARIDGAWTDVYRFDFAPQLRVDYEQQNWHTATRPNALFANNVVAAMPTPTGRRALFNRTLTWWPLGGAKERQTLQTKADLQGVLTELFGITPSEEEVDRAWELSGRASVTHPGFS